MSTERIPINDEFHMHHSPEFLVMVHTVCEPLTSEWDDEDAANIDNVNGSINIKKINGKVQCKCQGCGLELEDPKILKIFVATFLLTRGYSLKDKGIKELREKLGI